MLCSRPRGSGNRSREMDHPVIPAPARFDGGGGRFALRPGTKISCAATEVEPVVGRFCSEIARRTGLRLAPATGGPVADEPSVRIELANGDEFGALPAPLGVSPTGDGPADERYSLVIDAGQVVVRAAEPAGVARGLTTLVQLLAAVPSAGAGEISVPGARVLDAPRYAWRGLSLDLARAFFTLDEVRRVIDLLALYKLNVLHLHLTDDQGWRLPHAAAGREAGGRRRLLQRRGPAGGRRLRRRAPRHHRPRGGLARACVRAGADASGAEHRPERGRVRAPAGSPAPGRVARPGAARDLRADRAGAGRRRPDLPGPLYPHRRRRALRDAPRPVRVVRAAGALPGPLARQAPAGVAGVGARRPRPGRHHPVLVLRHRPAGLGAPPGPGAGRCRPGRLAPRRRDGGRGVGAGDRVTAEPLLPRRALRRAVGRSRAGGQTRPPRPAVLFA